MDEAERLCDRVAIVDHGKVIALGSPRDLIASLGGEHVVDFTLMNGEARERTASVDMTERAARDAGRDRGATGSRSLCALGHRAARRAAGHPRASAASSQLELASLTTRHASLEDVFVTLTGRHLRDEAAA